MTDADGAAEPAEQPDPDAPWRPGWTGPEPRPVELPPPGSARRVADPHGHSVPAELPDPWSRAADGTNAGEARVDDEVGEAEATATVGAPVDRTPAMGVPAPATPRRVVVGLAMVAVLAMVVAFAAMAWFGADERPGAVAALPDAVDELWSFEIDEGIGRSQVALVGDVVVVVDGEDLVGLDRSDGEQRWRRPVPLDVGTPVVDDVGSGVVALVDLAADQADAAGLDASTGAERWRRTSPEHRVVMADGVLLELADFTGGVDRFGTIALLDPATGRPSTERFAPAMIGGGDGRYVAVEVGGGVRILDLRQQLLVGPTVDPAGLVALVPIGDHALGIDHDEALVLFDETGDVVDRLVASLGTFGGGPFELQTLPGRDVAVAVGPTSLGVSVVDDRLDVVWSREGSVRAPVDTDDGPRAMMYEDTDLSMIDPLTGETVVELGSEPARSPLPEVASLWRNGITSGDGDDLVGLDLDGEERWRLSEVSRGLVIEDRILVAFEPGRLVAYG